MNQVRRLDFGVHMAVTGIGISDDHLLKILGFRLIPVAAGGHLRSKIANTTPYLKKPYEFIFVLQVGLTAGSWRFLTIFGGIFQGSRPLGTIFPVISTGTY